MSRLTGICIGLLTLGLSACGTQDQYSLVSDMSDATGISMTRPRQPVQLAALRPGLSAVGKDYLFAGPVSVSGLGAPQAYLWFALGSTIDRRYTGAPEPTFQTVILLIDGTPMTFDLSPWSGASGTEPYELDIRPSASYAAKITNSQIRQIANAQILEAYVADADNRSPRYSMVSGDLRDWLDFCCGGESSAAATH